MDMYDREDDMEPVAVKLTYLTDVTSTLTMAFAPTHVEETTYTQRGKGLEVDMNLAIISAGLSNEDFSMDFEVTPYHNKETSAGTYPGSAFASMEENGYSLSLTGTRGTVDEFIETLADIGYGLPEHNAFIADLKHPVRSFNGHRQAAETIDRLGELYEERMTETFESSPGVHRTNKEITYERI